MPRHLISDAHEWINEISAVPVCYLAKSQPRERAWQDRRGKKTLLNLTLVSFYETAAVHRRQREGGRQTQELFAVVTPLLRPLHRKVRGEHHVKKSGRTAETRKKRTHDTLRLGV